MGDLNETLTAEGMWEVLDYSFFPWGNAYFPQEDCPGRVVYERDAGLSCWQDKCGNLTSGETQPSSCFVGTPLCQHGDGECEGNRYEACAVAVGPIAAAADFTYCFEGVNDLSEPEACADAVGLDWSKLSQCFNSSEADAVVASIANDTAVFALENGWLGTPTVVLNGETLQSTTGLLAQVCIAAGDDAPAGCDGVRR